MQVVVGIMILRNRFIEPRPRKISDHLKTKTLRKNVRSCNNFGHRYRDNFKSVIECVQCDQIVCPSYHLPPKQSYLNSSDMNSIKNSSNAKWIFGLKWKATLFMLNYCSYFLGNFWKKLGYFLIQHLVTLVTRNLIKTRLVHFSTNVKIKLHSWRKNARVWKALKCTRWKQIKIGLFRNNFCWYQWPIR